MLDGCTPWPEEFVDRYWAAGHWSGNTLDNLLRGWALEYGPRTALVHDDTRLTYANLNRRVDRVAAGFRLRGLRPGQRVVVQLPNVPEFVVTVFALMRVGAVPVLCPLPHRTAEVSPLVRLTQAVGYVGPSTYQGFDHTAMAADIAAEGPFLRRVFSYEAPGTSSPFGGMRVDASSCHYFPLSSIDAPPDRAVAQSADQVAFLLPADGAPTTEPRLVPRTHNDYVHQARAAAELVSLTADDVYLAALPAGSPFAFGCPGIVGTLSVGGTVVLAENAEPGACLPLVEREQVTLTSVTPADAERWLDGLPTAQADLSSLRLVQISEVGPISGGGALARTTVERMGSEWGCRPQRVFGGAEGPLLFTRPTDPDETVRTTQGRPLSPDDEIRLVDSDGRDVPDGASGELLGRGPYTPRGHYRAPDHDARTFTPDGYFRTGALARRTPAGDLVVTGHLADPA
ncbi:AMP-binding protein [Streptomyces sp. NPDC087300]|uniref:AMP-binding protein n=1 Tax=Streptomyces sp. NPDC087300 TaxID=3365780 RepID=UPI00380BB6AD